MDFLTNISPEYIWAFLLYVFAVFVAIGFAQFYLSRYEPLKNVKGILTWVLYGIAIFFTLQFAFPLIGINFW